MKKSERASAHARKDFHLTAMTKMDEFLARYENPSHAVHTVLDSEVKWVMESNKNVIESLLKIVMLCGMQGLALRGRNRSHPF